MSAGDGALFLLLSGILLLYAEFNRPGTIWLAAAGSLLFMLGVAHLLPLHVSARYGLIGAGGIGLVLLELSFPLRSWSGAGALAGMLCLIFSLRNLVQGAGRVDWNAAFWTGTVFSVATYVLGRIAVLAARNKRTAARWPVPNLSERRRAATASAAHRVD